jgi:DNA polymerase-1
MSWYDGKESRLYLARDAKNAFLTSLETGVVCANISFDLGVAAAYWPDVLEPIFGALKNDLVYDVQLIEQLHDIATGSFYQDPITHKPIKGYSLAFLEQRHLGIDRSAEKTGPDIWRLRYHELDDIPLREWPAEAVKYAKDDAKGTLEVYTKQLERAGSTADKNWNCIHDEMRSAWALHLTSAWGIRTDPVYVSRIAAEIRQTHEESRKKFFEAGLVKLRKARGGKDPEIPDLTVDGKGMRYQTDTKKLKVMVAKAYPNPPVTAKGSIQCSRDTLAESGDDLLEAFAAAGENEKLFAVYVDVLESGAKTPINARYGLVSSGRTSCRTPNLQQLPRGGKIREAFVPRKGFLYCSCDYSTLELVTLAQTQLNWFGQSTLADAINAGQDVHLRMAARFDGVSYTEMLARYKAKDPQAKKLRAAAKPANFGLPGLLGAPKLVLSARAAYDVRFCEYMDTAQACNRWPRTSEYKGRTIPPTCVRCLELAQDIIKAWHAEWPEMKEYLNRCVRVSESGEPLVSEGNGMLRLEEGAGACANHFFQNLGAQGAKRALFDVIEAAYCSKTSVLAANARPVVFLHDEILAEVREEVAHEAACEIGKIMVTSMRQYTPDVLVKAEPCLMRRWFKGAEPVFENGKLVPWEPKI